MPTAMDTVKIWYGANGSETEERWYPEASGQSFKRGDLVFLSSGSVTVAVATGSNVAGGTKVLGIALKDASTTPGQPVPVVIANPNLRWVLPVSTSSGGIGNSANVAASDIGTAYELSHIAAGKWAVDKNATANAKVVVTAIHPQYGIVNSATGSFSGVGSTEAFGWVEVRFLDAQVDVAQ